MQRRLLFNEFSDVFQDNIQKRSRTAKGIAEVGMGSTREKASELGRKKVKLILEGEALRRQVECNTVAVILRVWSERTQVLPTPVKIRELAELWYDTINYGLQDPRAYDEPYKQLQTKAEALGAELGISVRCNPRYRLWDTAYGSRSVKPVALEFAMDDFYRDLATLIGRAQTSQATQAELLAYVDCEMDMEIHPWRDGCGRMATAVNMWLSVILPDGRLPVCAGKNEHYASIRTGLTSHTKYYERCLGLV